MLRARKNIHVKIEADTFFFAVQMQKKKRKKEIESRREEEKSHAFACMIIESSLIDHIFFKKRFIVNGNKRFWIFFL